MRVGWKIVMTMSIKWVVLTERCIRIGERVKDAGERNNEKEKVGEGLC